jgi:hypothetical protein
MKHDDRKRQFNIPPKRMAPCMSVYEKQGA